MLCVTGRCGISPEQTFHQRTQEEPGADEGGRRDCPGGPGRAYCRGARTTCRLAGAHRDRLEQDFRADGAQGRAGMIVVTHRCAANDDNDIGVRGDRVIDAPAIAARSSMKGGPELRSRAPGLGQSGDAVAHGIRRSGPRRVCFQGRRFHCRRREWRCAGVGLPKIGAPGRRGERDRRAVQNPPGFLTAWPTAPKSTPARRT